MRHLTPLHTLLFVLSLNLAPLLARAADTSTQMAVYSLLQEARNQFAQGQHEQAAALLERGLRIDPQNSVLWHNLAGVRLQQQNWERAISLAAKSNTFATSNRWLRLRNWTLIALSCEGMGNQKCADEARKRAHILAYQ